MPPLLQVRDLKTYFFTDDGVVKAVAADHDYRFDIPTIGPTTLEVMAAGGAAVLVVPRRKVLLVERDVVVGLAERAGIALVGIDEGRDGGL